MGNWKHYLRKPLLQMTFIISVTKISTGFIPVEHARYCTSAQTATYLSTNGVRYLTCATANIFSQYHTQHIYCISYVSYMLRLHEFAKMYSHTISLLFFLLDIIIVNIIVISFGKKLFTRVQLFICVNHQHIRNCY